MHGRNVIISESDAIADGAVGDLVVPAGHMAVGGSGLIAPKRDKNLCRYCGGAFESLDGANKHESQCREIARNQWTAAVLSGPRALTGAEVVALVNETIAAYDAREREKWVEFGMSGT
jgi:hypothetical protein